MDTNPPPNNAMLSRVDQPENPYFAAALAQSRIPAPTGLTANGHTTLPLGSHSLALRPSDRNHLTLVGYGSVDGSGNTGGPTTLRPRALANGTLAFAVGNTRTEVCKFGSVHILDNVMVFVATAGSVGPSQLGEGEHYALVAEPDLVVAVERYVDPTSAVDGFRVVLVNPIGAEPLVITVGGLDPARVSGLVTAGEAFMHGPVGSVAGWRTLSDGWQTMEWNGAPVAPVAAESRRIQIETQPPPAEPKRSWRLLAALGLAVVAVITLIAFATTLGGDDADETIASVADEVSAVTNTVPASTTTASTEPSTTTTEPPPSTTTSTAPPPTTELVPAGSQLRTWGFLERIELEEPSGNAACPAASTEITTGSVVRVAEGLNIRDGADSSFARIQRIALGYDEVRVFPTITTVSAKGTEWVQIALPEPPGWRELATWEAVASGDLEPGEDLDPFAYGCGWAATQFMRFDRAG